MEQHNVWLECLDCGNTYSTDFILCDIDMNFCPECDSTETLELEEEDLSVIDDYSFLNDSLMEGEDWD